MADGVQPHNSGDRLFPGAGIFYRSGTFLDGCLGPAAIVRNGDVSDQAYKGALTAVP